jgi:hypothetical protein
MEPHAPEWVCCPTCGADNRPEASRCFLCRHPIGPDAMRVPPSPEGVEPPASSAAGYPFSLGSLMLVIALAAVCLGVGYEAPGLGIALAIFSAPALIWTIALARQGESRGRPMPASAKVWAFLASLVAVVLVFLSAVIAFFATFFPIARMSRREGISPFEVAVALIVALIGGAVAAVAAAVFTYRKIRALRDRGDLT